MKKFLFAAAFALPLSMPILSAQNVAPSKTTVKAKQHAAKEEDEKENVSAPGAVKTAFKKRFPTVTKVNFGREKNGEYEAEFKLDGVKSSANFTAEGTWKETESEISAAMLPANIIQSISAKYPQAKIVGAAKIVTADNGTRYEADLKMGMKKKEVLFDEAGNLVK